MLDIRVFSTKGFARCFLTALCGNVTTLSSFAPKYTVQNPLWKRHVCPAFINVMIAGHTCIFHKGFCMVYFGAKEDNAVTLPHSAVRKHAFSGKSMGISKKNSKRKKIALEFMHQRLGHRYTRSLKAGDTANVWEDVELRIVLDPFCTSCQISSMNKKARSKLPLKPKAPFKWVFMDIIPSTAPKSLTNDTDFSNYLLIFDAYSKIPKLYGMENITTAEVMDKLDMFQSRFVKLTNLAVGIWKEGFARCTSEQKRIMQ